MYPSDDNSFDKPETSTEEIPSETQFHFITNRNSILN